MEIRLTFRVPSLLSLLRNKKRPQPSGKPAPIARFTLQELHFQILHHEDGKEGFKNKRTANKSLPKEKLHE